MSATSAATQSPNLVADRPSDAFECWLRGQTARHKPNPYELLGLVLLESNVTRIQAAINRQQQLIAGYESSTAPLLWQAFLSEFQAAVTVLSDRSQKELLDAALRRAGLGSLTTSADEPKPRATADIACATCQQANPADRKFCSACGGELWEACPKCQAARPASERFCGHCGLNVREFLAAQTAHLDEQLVLARRLHADGHFVDARRIAREIARATDPRAADQAAAATKLLDEFAAGQRESESRVATAVEQARRDLTESRYDAALAVLDTVPAALLTPEITQLRDLAAARQRESAQLLESIRAGLQRKQTTQLLPWIERFLTLKPGHAQVMRLAEQIARQVHLAARQQAQAGDWAAAIEAARTIPEFAVTDEIRKFVQECHERNWLSNEVRTSTVLHPALPALLERVAEQNPGQTFVATLRTQLQQRQADGSRYAWQAVPDWFPPPQRSSLGLSIDWATGPVRLAMGNAVTLPLAPPAMSRLFVAFGLAVQAIGQAAVDVNLAANQKSGVLNRLTQSLRRRGSTAGWGIDLGESSLKAVRLAWDEGAGRATIEDCVVLDLPSRSPTDESAGEAQRIEVLREFAAQHDLQSDRVAVGLPSLQCLARFLTVPNAPERKFRDLVQYEAKNQIPFPLDELAWEYVAPDEGAVDSHPKERQLLLLAAKKTVLNARLESFVRAGINADIVQCECVALQNYVRFDLAPRPTDSNANLFDKPVAILDVGHSGTRFLVSANNRFWFRTSTLGSAEFTKALMRQFKLTHAQADQAKCDPPRLRRLSDLATAWEPLFQQMRAECQRSLDQWKSLAGTAPPTRLLVAGGGALTYGLVDALRT